MNKKSAVTSEDPPALSVAARVRIRSFIIGGRHSRSNRHRASYGGFLRNVSAWPCASKMEPIMMLNDPPITSDCVLTENMNTNRSAFDKIAFVQNSSQVLAIAFSL